jgi:hypothetical protein
MIDKYVKRSGPSASQIQCEENKAKKCRKSMRATYKLDLLLVVIDCSVLYAVKFCLLRV